MSTVLIVDDSPADRALFRTLLGRAGFEVHELSTGEQATERARQVRPHIVILDVNLPDTDGHEVCRALKADPSTAGVPVLMLTVRDNEADILAGLEAGADDYIAKDAAPPVILARVRRLVRYRQLTTLAALNEGLVQVGRLLAGIVHEIRGPLSVIRGNAELLKMTVKEPHDAPQWIDSIVRSTRVLQVRLEHLMAAVRSGPPALEPLDVGELLREAADLFVKGSDLRASRVSVVREKDGPVPPVRADPGRLIQVFLNLLGNAREAILAGRPEGGRIGLRVARRDDERGDWVVVEVADDGPGIPEAHLGRIFEPFYTTKDQGSGYGLYLASEILREHGGRITACNRDAGGACFTVWLPAAGAAAERPA